MPCLSLYRQQWLRATFFDDSTTTGRAFGISVLVCILVSVCAVCAESVRSIDAAIGGFLFGLEVVLALLFTAELALRCAAAETVMHYVLSGFGVIDLVAVVPFYVELAMGADGAKVHVLVVFRVLRLARVLRLLKLAHFTKSASQLLSLLTDSWRKITVFLVTFTSLTVIVGAVMYTIEGAHSGFTSIPQGMYWAIVTLTTVGFGDIAPETSLGRFVAALVMLLGYSLIVVPSGLATLKTGRLQAIANTFRHEDGAIDGSDGDASPAAAGLGLADTDRLTRARGHSTHDGDATALAAPAASGTVDGEAALRCSTCGLARHTPDAVFCCRCGRRLPLPPPVMSPAAGVHAGSAAAVAPPPPPPAVAVAEPRGIAMVIASPPAGDRGGFHALRSPESP